MQRPSLLVNCVLVNCVLVNCVLLAAGSEAASTAADLLSADTAVSTAIDAYVDQQLSAGSISAAPLADESALLRRTTLDLAGRIPTAAEREWYFQQPEAERRVLLVEKLLSMPDFSLHLRNSIDELLLANRPYNNEFREYLLWAIQQQRPWHQMFREMLLAQETDGPLKGAGQFVKSRVRQLDDLTNDTAVLFFGVNISCAKCHDHPLVAEWKQDHYYGMQAFFSRTYSTKKNVLTERPFGQVKFTTTSGEEKPAALMFLTGGIVEDRTPDFSADERKQLEQQVRRLENDENPGYILIPDFSPRRALAEIALQDQQEFFLARNIVNRTWARLMGTGLVDPPDQMHSGNSPSHPELMQWLARDTVAHDYDLRRLIRGIVLSNAYARTSEWNADGEPPLSSTFALAAVRPLTPRQLAAAILVAVRNPDQWPEAEAMGEWERLRMDLENQANNWSREFEPPSANFQVAVDEALFFSNSDRVQNDLLRDSGDRVIGRLKLIDDDSEVVRLLWVNVLSRPPSDDEAVTALAWLRRENFERTESIRSLTWAMLAGPEIRFNY